jgi:hypothetical protein
LKFNEGFVFLKNILINFLIKAMQRILSSAPSMFLILLFLFPLNYFHRQFEKGVNCLEHCATYKKGSAEMPRVIADGILNLH